MSPPNEYSKTCEYEKFTGTTENELVLYLLSLQAKLDLCNLRITTNAEWIKKIQAQNKEE